MARTDRVEELSTCFQFDIHHRQAVGRLFNQKISYLGCSLLISHHLTETALLSDFYAAADGQHYLAFLISTLPSILILSLQ